MGTNRTGAAANVETLTPAISPRVAQRAAGGPAQIAVDAPSYLRDAVMLSACGTDGSMLAAMLSAKEADALAAMLRRMAKASRSNARALAAAQKEESER